MPFIFTSNQQKTIWGTQNNIFPSSITNVVATSPSTGVLSVSWTGGTGNKITYSYSIYDNSASALVVTSAYTVGGTNNPTSFTFSSPVGNSYTITVIATCGLSGLTGKGVSNSIAMNALPSFPTTNLLYDFSTLSGTSTTTNGATVATWTDARTGLVGSNYTSRTCTYRTDVTINSKPTVTGAITTTLGNTTTVQNYWTWYCVLRTGGTALTGDNNLIYNSASYALEIGLNTGNLKVCYSAIAWSVGAASVSGGGGSWVAAVNTNYILTVICTSTNNTTSSTQTYTFRINGVDYTGSSKTDSRYFYINNPIIGNFDNTTQTYMGEQILYNTTHSLSTAQQMEQYLSYKWNIPIGATPAVASSPTFSN